MIKHIKEKNNNNKVLLLMDLNNFKVEKCKINTKHEFMICNYYHNKEDKRRNLFKYSYNYIMCKNKTNCKKKKKCNFSHNKIEILYHPYLYKKKFCKKFMMNGNCKFDNICFFAHTEEELRINLIHKLKINYMFFLFYFKTEFCPLGKIKHDLNMCVYSHNLQDFKRTILNEIKPIKCKNWESNKNYEFYNDGCPNGISCKYIHGWKEVFFHPENFKKKPCKNNINKCIKKFTCSFLHDNEKKIILYDNFFLPNLKSFNEKIIN